MRTLTTRMTAVVTRIVARAIGGSAFAGNG